MPTGTVVNSTAGAASTKLKWISLGRTSVRASLVESVRGIHRSARGGRRVDRRDAYPIWEAAADFKRAFNDPEFHAKMKDYPASTVASPYFFRKVTVPRICVA